MQDCKGATHNFIPANSEVASGPMMPMLGRTQYFLGDVVLTCQLSFINPSVSFSQLELLPYVSVHIKFNKTMRINKVKDGYQNRKKNVKLMILEMTGHTLKATYSSDLLRS